MIESSGLTGSPLPAVVLPGATLNQATPGGLADKLGLSYRRSSAKPVDVTIVGAARLAWRPRSRGVPRAWIPCCWTPSAPAGQAAASSPDRELLRLPVRPSGADLTGLAVLQALKFGAQLASPCQAVALRHRPERRPAPPAPAGREVIDSEAIIIATGARYRALPLNAGLASRCRHLYAATELEARACTGSPVTVIGGANSAGQAALYLAGRGSQVSLVVRAGHRGPRVGLPRRPGS